METLAKNFFCGKNAITAACQELLEKKLQFLIVSSNRENFEVWMFLEICPINLPVCSRYASALPSIYALFLCSKYNSKLKSKKNYILSAVSDFFY